MSNIKIEGVDELVSLLGGFNASNALRPAMERSLARLQRDLAAYPPPRPSSRYRRGYGFPGRPTSERLGASWTTRINPSPTIRGEVGTNVSYAPYVQSEERQAWMHNGRWPTDASVLNENERAIVADFEREIERLLS